jgi:isopenicillin N synthase-like dioxygenase
MLMKVPVIDFQGYDEGKTSSPASLSNEVELALSKIGFMSVTNLGIDKQLLDSVFAASRTFFSSDASSKMACAYQSASENFGYQGLCEEHLDPTKPADLKETFTMRDVLNHSPDDSRWPSVEFKNLMHDFYQACINGANKVQRVLAQTLDVDSEFFVRHHSGENITLRLLYYPDTYADEIADAQMGAGAHTDYGLLTLLFQDEVGGLEVRDADDVWQAVDYVESAIIVNSGDLLERWTNGRYRSTWHRVKPKIGQQERYSIAIFVDPDSATPVAVLDSCTDEDHPAQYSPITAGEHLQQKIQASHADKFEQ